VLALAAFQRAPSLEFLILVMPIAMLVLLILASALSIFLAAINVPYRDTGHLLELALMLWFWMTPIVYQFGLVATKLADRDLPIWLVFLNPIVPITLAFQRSLYNQVSFTDGSGNIQQILPYEDAGWYLWHLGLVGVLGVGLLYGAMVVFGRIEGNFAEEL